MENISHTPKAALFASFPSAAERHRRWPQAKDRFAVSFGRAIPTSPSRTSRLLGDGGCTKSEAVSAWGDSALRIAIVMRGN